MRPDPEDPHPVLVLTGLLLILFIYAYLSISHNGIVLPYLSTYPPQ